MEQLQNFILVLSILIPITVLGVVLLGRLERWMEDREREDTIRHLKSLTDR